MHAYLDLLREVRTKGERRPSRAVLPSTGLPVDTFGLFGRQIRFDLARGFPAVTTKRLFFKGVVGELLWMLSGSSNVRPLQEQGIHIWDAWADPAGDLGPVYGSQWRLWPKHTSLDEEGSWGVEPIDQIAQVIEGIRRDPYGRRHIVSAWNVADLPKMALPPCHLLFQFYVAGGRLSCQLYQRSADIFLGVPFNIASYALLTCLIAQVTGLRPGEFVHTFGDVHLYANHLEQADLQLGRDPHPPPALWLNPERRAIDDFRFEDIEIRDYHAHPPIKAEVAV